MNKKLMPKGSTLEEFFDSSGKLFPAEKKLLDACRNGNIAKISAKRPDQSNQDNIVRAEFIRFLALQTDSDAPLHTNGIRLVHSYITGELDFSHSIVKSPLDLEGCNFEQELLFNNASLHHLSLIGSQIPGLQGTGLICTHDLFLKCIFSNGGQIHLVGAKIGGLLDLYNARLESATGIALCADAAEIDGGVFMTNGFYAIGCVRLLHAKIGGTLDCRKATIENPKGDTLYADGAVINGTVFLNEFSANGQVRLIGITINGDLACQGAILRVGDSYDSNGIKNTIALTADAAKIRGGVYMRHPFESNGEIRFPGAKIGGDVDLSGANLNNTNNCVLRIVDADIGSHLYLRDLVADETNTLHQFSAFGEIRLSGSKIGGDFICKSAKMENAGGTLLRAEGLQINGKFVWRGLNEYSGEINLLNCSVQTLADDINSWPEGLILDGFTYHRLAGTASLDAKKRIAWLQKQKPEYLSKASFKPQPWEQLVSVLQREGHVAAARTVAIEAQYQRQRAGQLGKWWNPRRWFHIIFGLLIGFGYSPIRTLIMMFNVWLGCSFIYMYAAEQSIFAPSNPLVFQHYSTLHCRPDYVATQVDIDKKTVTNNWVNCAELRGEYTTFNPFLYSLDVILPLVDLQQEKDWGQYIDKPFINWPVDFSKPFNDQRLNHVTRFFMWFEILFGWICSLILVAVLSGLAKTDKD